MSRSSSQPFCHTQRRTGSLSRSKLAECRSEVEGCELIVIALHRHQCFPVCIQSPGFNWLAGDIWRDLNAPQQVLPPRAGVLLKYGEQADEGCHGVAGCAEIGITDLFRTMLHKLHERLIGQRQTLGIACGEHLSDVIEKNVEILTRQILQSDHRAGEIDEPVASEAVLRKARLKRGVAVEPTPRVHQKLRRAPHEKADIGCAPLQDLSLIHISEPTRQAEISYAV